MNLERDALWIIMDPWKPTPYSEDLLECPNLDDIHEVVMGKILDYIPRLNHVCVSCPTFIYDPTFKKVHLHPSVEHLHNLKNYFHRLFKYMNHHNLSNIVYCGFHYGDCILGSADGAVAASKHYQVYVKRDLCGLYPTESWEEEDKKTKIYAEII